MPWYAFGLTEYEERVPLPLVNFEQPPSISAFRRALSGLDDYLPRGDEPVPGVDAIQSWAELAVDPATREGADGLAAWEEGGLALVEAGRPQAVVWHHASSMALDVPAGLTTLELEYRTAESDDYRHRREAWRLWDDYQDDVPWESSLLMELNGVVGTESFRSRDIVAVPWRIARGSVKAALNVAGLPLKLLGGAVGTAGASMYTEEDDSFPGRLAHEEQNASAVAAAFQRLGDGTSASGAGPVAVIVHGFGSCAMPAAQALSQRGFGGRMRTYRFEHDTFLGPRKNARELARLVREAAPDRAILFVCHSRGGLVGRYAAAELTEQTTRVLTLGTPHAGTPIAATWGTGTRALFQFRNLYYNETQSTGGTPHPESVARSYITRAYPPPGLTALRPKDEFFENLAVDAPAGDNLTAYGAEFRARESAGGPLSIAGDWAASQLAEGLFHGEPNDLIVSTASATAVAPGRGRVLKTSCAHSSYYADTEALDAIDEAAEALRGEVQSARTAERQAELKNKRPKIRPRPDDE